MLRSAQHLLQAERPADDAAGSRDTQGHRPNTRTHTHTKATAARRAGGLAADSSHAAVVEANILLCHTMNCSSSVSMCTGCVSVVVAPPTFCTRRRVATAARPRLEQAWGGATRVDFAGRSRRSLRLATSTCCSTREFFAPYRAEASWSRRVSAKIMGSKMESLGGCTAPFIRSRRSFSVSRAASERVSRLCMRWRSMFLCRWRCRAARAAPASVAVRARYIVSVIRLFCRITSRRLRWYPRTSSRPGGSSDQRVSIPRTKRWICCAAPWQRRSQRRCTALCQTRWTLRLAATSARERRFQHHAR
mmetsp:Transcript_121413/g.338265  ORF Transcript_121413/g.338265 Transcript_121413/m.338265 type:complete len:305 (-) Transcript_121413:262-1176(-)